MTAPQIRPGLVFKQYAGENAWTYRVKSEAPTAGVWLVQVIDLNGHATNGTAVPMAESVIRAALSRGETK